MQSVPEDKWAILKKVKYNAFLEPGNSISKNLSYRQTYSIDSGSTQRYMYDHVHTAILGKPENNLNVRH